MARNNRRTSVWSGLALAAATLMAALPAAAAVEPARLAPPTPIPVAESHGFVLDKGRVTTFDAPGAFTTQAWDITNTGRVIGQYYDDGEQHGFVRDRRGQISTVDFPGEDGSLNESIGGNDRGEIVGSHGNYDPENGELQAHVRDLRDRFATHDVPGALVTGAFKNNNRGQVVGAYSVESRRVPIRAYRGYLLEDDKFTPIDAPGATYTPGIDINDRGQMIGIGVVPDARVGFGFLRDRNGSYSRPPDVPGAAQTVPFGINNRGQIVGAYASLSAAGTPVIRGMIFRTASSP